MLRVRLLEEVPDIQSLVGVWAPGDLLELFDQIYGFGPKVRALVTTSIHAKFEGRRLDGAISESLRAIERLLSLLNEVRDLLQVEHLPTRAG